MKKFTVVGIYSVIHCIVDLACAMLIAGILAPVITGTKSLIIGIILYNLFAFAFQLPFGILADKINKNAIVSLTGCFCIIVAYAINSFTILACIIAGIGNALFHVGGGIDVLNIANKEATLPGIYVSTGAMGLYIGTKAHILGFNSFYMVILLLMFSILALLWLHSQSKGKYTINNEEPNFENMSSSKQIVMYCLLVTICIRSYIGLILNFEWKVGFIKGLLCISAVVLGKIFGGIIGDKFGWRKVSTISLILAAILFVFSFNSIICGILAILLFNMTMPITLTALCNMFNSNKGMAFGLTTLALFIGAVPVLIGYNDFLFNSVSLFVITIISSLILYIGLKKYEEAKS